jgi:hypothetical protein
MKPLVLIRVIFMVLLLAAVVYVMRNLNSSSMDRAFGNLGIAAGNAQAPGLHPSSRLLAPGEEAYNLCPTRVRAVIWPDGKKIEEKKDGLKLRWMAADPQPREIGYLEVEKWLSQHCQIAVQKKPADATALAASSKIIVQYIDGSEKTFGLAKPGEFIEGGSVLISSDLESALAELRKIGMLN